MGVKYAQLTEGERNQIYALKQAKKSIRQIAKQMKRNPSTISREIERNSGQRGYRPKQAQRKAQERHKKPRTHKLTNKIKNYIEGRLHAEWSPEQISATMEAETGSRVSHERIYQHIWNNKENGGMLYKQLRIAGKKQKRKQRGSKDWRGKIPNRIDIDQRPKVVANKARTGDWEADLVSGAHHQGFLVTLVERRRKFTLIGHVRYKQSLTVQQEIIRLLFPYKKIVHTITFDNGHEFSGHEAIAEALKCSCYFAKPYHSWERGVNENTNGLIRQYFPKKSDLRQVSQYTLNHIMDRLNHRPRKTLAFHTPFELFYSDHHCCT